MGGKRDSDEMRAIWKAQGRRCPTCGVGMLPVHKRHPTRGWTFEHVYNNGSRRYLREGNLLVTHADCNNRKANREPTGCEIIMLHAVNAQLGFELTRRERHYRAYSDAPPPNNALADALRKAGVPEVWL